MPKRRYTPSSSSSSVMNFNKIKQTATAKDKKNKLWEKEDKTNETIESWTTALHTPIDEAGYEEKIGVKVNVGTESVFEPDVSFVVYVVKDDGKQYELRLLRNEFRWLTIALRHDEGVQKYHRDPQRETEVRFMSDQELLRLQITDEKGDVFKIYTSVFSAPQLAEKMDKIKRVIEFNWKEYVVREIYLAATVIQQEEQELASIDLEAVGNVLGIMSPRTIAAPQNLEHEADRIRGGNYNAPATISLLIPEVKNLLALINGVASGN